MSMTYVAARDALITAFNTAWSTSYPLIPVQYENHAVDADKVGDVYLRVGVEFDAADQMSIELNPLTRVWGQLCVGIMSKEGQGTRSSMAYADFIINLFKYQNLSGVIVGAPAFGHKESHDGWHYQEILVPFRFTN